jgi:putative transposase
MYHMVFPAKYRRKVFSKEGASILREVCIGISECYEIHFIEIGMDEDGGRAIIYIF